MDKQGTLVLTRYPRSPGRDSVTLTIPPSDQERKVEVVLVDIMGRNKARLAFVADKDVAIILGPPDRFCPPTRSQGPVRAVPKTGCRV